MTFHLTCVYISLSSVCVAEWPPFGKYLLTRLTICSLCILTTVFVIVVISQFGFEGWINVLIDSVPDRCIVLFTFKSRVLPTNIYLRLTLYA